MRRAADSEETTGEADVPSNSDGTSLGLARNPRELPASIIHKCVAYNLTVKTAVLKKTKSSAWGFLDLYKSQHGAGKKKEKLALCRVCHRVGMRSPLLLADANVRNAIKHFRQMKSHDVPTKM